jgi:hypothetical protein
MRFAVPQFIDVEDKIFGPLTLKQGIYLAGGGGVVAVLFTQFGFFMAFLFGAPIAGLAIALAFLKVNNRPFFMMVYAAFFYFLRNRLYLWKKVPKKVSERDSAGPTQPRDLIVAPRLSQSRLKELAWSLDTQGSMYTNEKQWKA